MYNGLLLGFRQGLQVFDLKSGVTSRKFTSFRLHTIVILSPGSLKILVISLRMRSQVFLLWLKNAARPSSRYRPIWRSLYFSCNMERMQITSSHTSAPSKLPIVTSNLASLPFFTHASSLLNNSYLLACMHDDFDFLVTDSDVLLSMVNGACK